MSLAQANKEKNKVRLSATDTHDANNMGLLPEPLRTLIERSVTLQNQVRRLDATMHSTLAETMAPPINPVEHQLGLLKAAFEAEQA